MAAADAPASGGPSRGESVTLHHETRAVSIDRLGPPDLVDVFAFLDRDPVVNVYLVALALRDGLAQPRDEFWGARRDGDLIALLYLGGQSGAVLLQQSASCVVNPYYAGKGKSPARRKRVY